MSSLGSPRTCVDSSLNIARLEKYGDTLTRAVVSTWKGSSFVPASRVVISCVLIPWSIDRNRDILRGNLTLSAGGRPE